MLHLVDVSVSERDAVAATMDASPLLAADADCCAKTWLATQPGVALRPWRRSTGNRQIHIVGWSREAPQAGDGHRVRVRRLDVAAGEVLDLTGRFLAIRRCNNVQGSGIRSERDAAKGRADPVAAYEAWLRERLIDVLPFAAVESVAILGFASRTALRKGRSDKVRTTTIPVVDATIRIRVREPAGVEAWLLNGVGPQKAFGYGAFVPAAAA